MVPPAHRQNLSSGGFVLSTLVTGKQRAAQVDFLALFGTLVGFQPHVRRCVTSQKVVGSTSYQELGTSVKDGRYLSLQEVLTNAPQVRVYSYQI